MKLTNQYSPYKPVTAKSSGPNYNPELPAIQDVSVTARNSKSYTRQQKVTETLAPKDLELELEDAALNLSTNFQPTELQLKYSSLLEVLPGKLLNTRLLESIDEWYGTRYRYGGTTKKGVDCSAFVRAVCQDAFDIYLPRTAREQYRAVRRISTTELKEGDLVFFNTTGGVSHVGMYLRNNKFVHASSSRGVIVSDLYDAYYISRFLGGGRIKDRDHQKDQQGYLAAANRND
ncbi:hypothetical protein GCM10027051_23040 [Niabella terrae]